MPMPEPTRSVRAGELRHRVTLQDYTITRASTGEDTKAWFDVATLWAKVEPLSLRWREFLAAQQRVNEVTTSVRIRYRSGVRPRMRFLFQGRQLQIESVINPYESARELLIFCSEVIS